MLETYIVEGTHPRVVERYNGLKAAAEAADFGALDEDVVVIDTETTGVSFKTDELTQIAAARMSKGQIVEWFVTFVNPGKPIPEEIVHLTNITDADVADAPRPEEAVAQLAEFVGTSNLVAHNASFDKHFCTKPESGRALTENLWIDSLDLARIGLPRLKSHRLLDLVRAFDAPISTHRADADVEALCAVYRILLAAVAAMPPELARTIADMADEDVWPTAHVFKELSPLGTEPFDLRRLRYEQVGTPGTSSRPDADDLASDPARGLSFPSQDEVRTAFAPDGLVGSLFPAYESRDEQVAMAEAVNQAFAGSVNLAVEAGTGVGKSMAYLVPAVLAAKRNNITVGVATKTNALLDQLVNHELPLLKKQLPDLQFCSLKGFSHYPCLRQVERLLKEGPGVREVAGEYLLQAPALAGLLSFIEQSTYDDIDGLKIDYRALPRWEITTSSHDCLRRKCPFFGTKCFVHGARNAAERADVVVTNQSLLFCDVAADGGLLPPIRYWVIDEAHGAEAEARAAFSCTIDAAEIERIIRKVASGESGRNVFTRAERQLAGQVEATEASVAALLTPEEMQEAGADAGLSAGDTLLFALTGKGRRAADAYAAAAREFILHMHDLLFFDASKRSSGYDTVDVWINDDVRSSYSFQNLANLGRIMCDASEKLITACQELVAFMEDSKGAAAVQREIASVALTLKDLLGACEIILFTGPETFAYSAHMIKRNSGRQKGSESLSALMLNVGDAMNESLYARTHSVVFTSATMTIAESFESFTGALGLGSTEHSVCQTLKLDSSYDFDTNMTVYVATDMPEPNDPHYLDALVRLLVGVHRASQGSTLTLFTNRREMEASHAQVQPAVAADDLRIVCQKWGVSVKGLRDEFLADEHLSLFALKSFWEGFDAPGATLKTVVIPKLPFNKPTDPLSCARQERDSQAWAHYVLPAAVLETKQAAGRLIRTSTDTGSLVLADKRLVTKSYGKTFLRSMPSKNVKTLTIQEICDELAAQHTAQQA